MSLTRIGSIGINTGIAFAGVTTIVTLNTANDALSIGATVNIGSGNLTVGSGVTISSDGDGFYTGVVTATTFSGALAASNLTGALPAISAANLTNVPAANITGTLPAISGANLTNLDASDLASGTVPTARLGSGTASSSTFLRGDSTFQTVNTDLVSDTSPQLGGNLASNGNNINIADSTDGSTNRITVGSGGDLQIYHDSNDSYIQDAGAGHLNILATNFRVRNADSDEIYIVANDDGAVELYHDNSQKFTTSSSGVTISADTSTGSLLKGVTRFCPSGSTTVKVMYDEGGFSGAGHFQVKDGVALTSGDSSDLKIYHDSTNTYIKNTTNDLLIQNTGDDIYIDAVDDIFIRTSTNEDAIKCLGDGAVELYHNSSKKVQTESAGITVFGSTQVDGTCHPYSDNASDLGLTSNRWQDLYLSGSAYIGGTGSANALDDYEEGQWTPQTHDGSVSYQNAKYTKIGRQVTVVARLYSFSDNSTNDAIRIKNLPFAADITSVAAGSVMYSYGGQSNATVLYLDAAHHGSFNRYGGHSGAFDNFRHNELSVSSGSTDMYIIATYFTAT